MSKASPGARLAAFSSAAKPLRQGAESQAAESFRNRAALMMIASAALGALGALLTLNGLLPLVPLP